MPVVILATHAEDQCRISDVFLGIVVKIGKSDSFGLEGRHVVNLVVFHQNATERDGDVALHIFPTICSGVDGV